MIENNDYLNSIKMGLYEAYNKLPFILKHKNSDNKIYSNAFGFFQHHIMKEPEWFKDINNTYDIQTLLEIIREFEGQIYEYINNKLKEFKLNDNLIDQAERSNIAACLNSLQMANKHEFRTLVSGMKIS